MSIKKCSGMLIKITQGEEAETERLSFVLFDFIYIYIYIYSYDNVLTGTEILRKYSQFHHWFEPMFDTE